MSAQGFVRQLFAPPGAAAERTRHLLAQAAGAHARLLDSSRSAHEPRLDQLREDFTGYLRGPAPATEKRFVLDDPQFVEALHALAGVSGDLTDWDLLVAPGCYHAPPDRAGALARGLLGNVVLGIILRRRRGWCGRLELATDDYARVHVPFCDWVLVVQGAEPGELLAHEPLVLELDAREVRWLLPERLGAPWVTMPREAFDTMFADNRPLAPIPAAAEHGVGPEPRFERAARLGRTRIRFEPISAQAPATHARQIGAIVASLLEAIGCNAPAIHDQLCQSIRTIQGFELPPYGAGQIASFSVPTSPGVIGFNVQYTAADEPQLSPYCFMWLGHELGHTLHYLIDDVAYAHGWQFLENPGERTPPIARYGRSLNVRTLFQVPYVHLFEWWLLVRFMQHHFAGLPWQMFDDARAVGDDLRAEIAEAFAGIDRYARLTPAGGDVVAWLHELVGEVETEWRKLCPPARRPSRRRA
jgi:hypothetical protein